MFSPLYTNLHTFFETQYISTNERVVDTMKHVGIRFQYKMVLFKSPV